MTVARSEQRDEENTHKHVEKDPKITDEIWVQPWDFFFLHIHPAFHFSLQVLMQAERANYVLFFNMFTFYGRERRRKKCTLNIIFLFQLCAFWKSRAFSSGISIILAQK